MGYRTTAMDTLRSIGRAIGEDTRALGGARRRSIEAAEELAAAKSVSPHYSAEEAKKYLERRAAGTAQDSAALGIAGNHLAAAAGIGAVGGLGYIAGTRTNPTRGGSSFNLGGHTLAFK